ncbi:MAG: hypothetical protein LBQ06_00210 [Frankiaceae bacterium]|jgi:hypothetical protein|nr:hypothetical protein [Frankiaceae bacterium]
MPNIATDFMAVADGPLSATVINVTPPRDEEQAAVMLEHILADVHDISQRLRRLEASVDEMMPVARQYVLLTGLRRLGRGHARV